MLKLLLTTFAACAVFISHAGTDQASIAAVNLPDHLLMQYKKIQPQLTERNSCVAAFNDSHDTEHMLLECSFYTRHASESERRALRFCEQKRKSKGIASPCRVIVD